MAYGNSSPTFERNACRPSRSKYQIASVNRSVQLCRQELLARMPGHSYRTRNSHSILVKFCGLVAKQAERILTRIGSIANRHVQQYCDYTFEESGSPKALLAATIHTGSWKVFSSKTIVLTEAPTLVFELIRAGCTTIDMPTT